MKNLIKKLDKSNRIGYIISITKKTINDWLFLLSCILLLPPLLFFLTITVGILEWFEVPEEPND